MPGKTSMDALILTCGTGGGHNTAALAVKEALESRGHRVDLLNPYELLGSRAASRINNAYIRTVQRAPWVFGCAYLAGEAYRRLPVRSPVYQANRAAEKVMEQYLNSHSYQVILATHVFPGMLLTRLKRRGVPLPPLILIATDYACIPFFEEVDCDYCVIPSPKLTNEFLRFGFRPEQIRPLGIPVRKSFRTPESKPEARRRLQLSEDSPCILLAGGSIGAGKIKGAVRLFELSAHRRPACRLVVVCGNNRRLYQCLRRRCKKDPSVRILSQTNQMADYMRAADLLISKPGGLSSTEAAVSGAPLVHFSPIPGCESKNYRFFTQNGMSLGAKSTLGLLHVLCDKKTPARLEAMKKRQAENVNPEAALDICRLAEEAAEANSPKKLDKCRKKGYSMRENSTNR